MWTFFWTSARWWKMCTVQSSMENKKILCYVYDNMADFEISLALHYLRNIGNYEIVSVAENLQPVTAQSGLSFVPNVKISQLTDLEPFEALIIGGGPINNKQNAVCPLIKNLLQKNKLVAAICFAPQFLWRAGVLNKYKFTTSCTQKDICLHKTEKPFPWENYHDVRCITDKNLITAKGHAFVDFAQAICKYLNIFKDNFELEEHFNKIKSTV